MQETIIMAAILAGALLLWLFVHRERPARFRKKTVLTGSELEFFFRLREALPACVICPEIAVSALIEPVGIGAQRQQALARIAEKRVGYAVFDEDMQLIAVVELNHRRRLSRSETARDAYFASAGIKTVRFHAKRLPSREKIHARVFSREKAGTHAGLGGGNDVVIEYQRPPRPWRNTVNAHV